MYSIRKDTEVYLVEDFAADKYVMSVTKLYSGKETSGHRHNHDELYYIAAGNGILIIDNLQVNIQAGEFMHIQANQFHKVINIGDKTLLFVCAWHQNNY